MLSYTSNHRRAVTLIELLIVIVIMLMMAAVAVPRLLPAFKDRKMRELSRQLNAYFAGAKARAAERNRPVGVVFSRSAQNQNECLEVYMADVRPFYTGDSLNAVANLQVFNSSTVPNAKVCVVQFMNAGTLDALATTQGQVVFAKFNYQGDPYTCTYDSSLNGTYSLGPGNFYSFPTYIPPTPPAISIPPYPDYVNDANGTISVPYQVLIPETTTGSPNAPKNPIRSNVTPLDVPSGLAISLQYSGIGLMGTDFDYTQNNGNGTNQNYPVTVMYSPSGDVTSIYYNGVGHSPAGGQINFLVGQNTGGTTPPAILDLKSFWVSVNVRSGAITTAENFPNSTMTVPLSGANMATCRKYVQSAQSKGGG